MNGWLARCLLTLGAVAIGGCSFELSVTSKNKDSSSTSDPGAGAPSNSLDYSKSDLLLVPTVGSVPSTGQLIVRYCLKDQDGNAFDNNSLALNFTLQSGTSTGSFSAATYNSTDKCYESTFTADADGTTSEIIAQVSSQAVASAQTQHIQVTEPNLGFTGNSQPTTAIATRVFNESGPAWLLTGTCDQFLGDVSVAGGISSVTTTSCLPDGTFSLAINVDGVTPPFFATGAATYDPLIKIKQGSLEPKMTRLYRVLSTWTNTYIATPAQLQAMTVAGSGQNKNYFLLNDIDLSTVALTNNFTPLGNSSGNYWSGRLFGDGHKILNLDINGAGGVLKGLIGYSSAGAYVFDVAFENANLTNGGAIVGILAGMFRLSYAKRISVQGAVVSTGTVGLIVGQSWDSAIYDSWSSGSVTATGGNAGGLLGYSWGGDLYNCWSDATVTTSTKNSGGLVGYVTASNVYIKDSFAQGAASANEGAGGFIGALDDPAGSNVNVTDDFSLGNVNATTTGTTNISGPMIGSAGWSVDPTYTPFPDPVLTGLYYLSGMTCTNCSPSNHHASAATLANILSWSQTTWDYDWTWKLHSSGTRPDLITNPRL